MKAKTTVRCLFLCVMLILLFALPALAEESARLTEAETEAENADLLPMPYSIGIRGEVTAVAEGRITVEYTADQETGSTTATLVLKLTENTPCVDNATGQAAPLDGIKAGDSIYAYHSPVVAESYPPQSQALAILVNIGDSVPAHLHLIETVEPNADGSIRFLSDNSSIYVSVGEEAELLPYLTKNIVGIDQLVPGSLVLAWYDVALMSYPAQAGASRVVYLQGPADAADLPLTVHGTGRLLPVTGKMEDGLMLVPLRAVAEALGFSVSWDQATGGVRLSNDAVSAKLQIGADSYTVSVGDGGAGEPRSLARAPYLVAPGVTWAPAGLFDALLGAGTARYYGDSIGFVPPAE